VCCGSVFVSKGTFGQGNSCAIKLSFNIVYKWFEKFAQGHMKLEDNDRPSCPAEIPVDETVSYVQSMF
jgi:hypothetical protein